MTDPIPSAELPARRPLTRATRLSVIEEILTAHVVTSQQQLMDMLGEQGLDVTQSTLSRDLDELHAVKTHRSDGLTAYVLPHMMGQNTEESDTQSLARALKGLVVSADSAGNIVVIHTPSGAAQYLGTVLDRAQLPSVLGTIAGDDTVMAVTSDEKAAHATVQRILQLTAAGGPDSIDKQPVKKV